MILSAKTISLFLFNKPFIRNISVSRLLRFKDHYKSLGLSSTATQEEIKSAFFELSKKFHPDLNNNSEESTRKFQEITAAYEVLGNEKSRKEYDLDTVGSYPKAYRKRDIDEQIFRSKFYNTNMDPWNTRKGRHRETKDGDKDVGVHRKFEDVPEVDLKERLYVVNRWMMFFFTLCLSGLIGSILPFFDLRTEFIEEEFRKQSKLMNDKQSDNQNRKVVYIFKYSG